MKVLLMKQHAGIFPLHNVACLCNVYKYQNVTTVLLLSELRHFVVVRVCACAAAVQHSTLSLPTL